MKLISCRLVGVVSASLVLLVSAAMAQIGTRFPSEKKVVPDPVTGVPVTFLTSKPNGDSKIYQTHHQWTADGKWLVFRSNRVRGEAMAVNEATGDIVQVTEGGYSGMLCLADNSLNLCFLRIKSDGPPAPIMGGDPSVPRRPPRGPAQIIRVDLAKVFADSAAGKMQAADVYQKACGTIPVEWARAAIWRSIAPRSMRISAWARKRPPGTCRPT